MKTPSPSQRVAATVHQTYCNEKEVEDDRREDTTLFDPSSPLEPFRGLSTESDK